MPMDRSLYPDNWEEISREIRERAGDRCEVCGAVNGQPHPLTRSLVVLTVAHLDHNPENCDRGNLKAMCQKCHLTYDAETHAQHAAITRRHNLLKAGQISFLEDES